MLEPVLVTAGVVVEAVIGEEVLLLVRVHVVTNVGGRRGWCVIHVVFGVGVGG